MSGLDETMRLRPETPGDEPLLRALYATTRAQELAQTGWEDAAKEAFIDMQFQAQRRGYREAFPDAEFSIVTLHGEDVGRFVLNRSADEYRVVDIIIAPEHRGRGLGTALIQSVLQEAATVGKTVRLRVIEGNPARHLYERLGFRAFETNGLYHHLECRPALSPSGPPLS